MANRTSAQAKAAGFTATDRDEDVKTFAHPNGRVGYLIRGLTGRVWLEAPPESAFLLHLFMQLFVGLDDGSPYNPDQRGSTFEKAWDAKFPPSF